MTEMVERVAKAISGAPFATSASRRKARAAIEAMREPTDAMVLAGARYSDDNWRPTHAREDTNAEVIWQDMLDAALSETPHEQ